MTEWTSLSCTQAQKEQLEAEKPAGMSMGKFLVSRVVEGEQPMQDVDTSEIVECQQQTIEELEQQRDMLTELLQQSVSLEASERAQIAREVVEALQ